MKFIIKATSLDSNIFNEMRSLGYHFLSRNDIDLEINFVRPLPGSGGYPRFHAYIKIDPKDKELSFNLHLDQKRPIYKGTTAHSGEYDGELVEKEAERLKKSLK